MDEGRVIAVVKVTVTRDAESECDCGEKQAAAASQGLLMELRLNLEETLKNITFIRPK